MNAVKDERERVDSGTEHREGHVHEITIIVNNRAVTTEARELTGLQIKQLAGIPADYELFQVVGSNSVPVGNDEKVHLHPRQEFRAIPAGTFGSC